MHYQNLIVFLIACALAMLLVKLLGAKKLREREERKALSHDHSHEDHDHGHHGHGHGLGKLKHDHSSGVFSIDYYAYISAMREWNPAFKVFFSLLVLVLCIIFNSIYVSLFVLITMGFIIVYRGKIPFHQYFSTLTIPIVFVIVGSITIAIGFSREPIGEFNFHLFFFYIYTSKESLMKMANLMLKAMGAVSALYLMTLSTPSGEIISVMRKVHVPKLFVELMSMIYRYIFVIMETQKKMKDSAESRLGYVDYKTAIKSFTGTASNLLVVSLKKANAYYDALVSRGYNGELLFLERKKALDTEQIVLGCSYILLMCGVFFASRIPPVI